MFLSLEQNPTMFWADVIDRNSTALKAIIGTLYLLLGCAPRLTPGVYRRVLRGLRPAESALRRLIVIASRVYVIEVAPLRVRPVAVKPALATPVASTTLRPKPLQRGYSFPLFDPRKPVSMIRKRKTSRVVPRIRLLDWGYDPRISVQFPPPRVLVPAPAPPPPSDGLVDAARITRRLHALRLALDDLPGQAARLVRLQQKREAHPGPVFKTPIRPGHPPGYRRRKRREIDDVLIECHHLALEALKVNTS
jgi:hypothetical protein